MSAYNLFYSVIILATAFIEKKVIYYIAYLVIVPVLLNLNSLLKGI